MGTLLWVFLLFGASATAQECDEGTVAFFEKTTLHELTSTGNAVRPTKLETRGGGVGVTAVCSKACLDQGTSGCPGFLLNYATAECFSLDRNTQGIEDFLQPARGVVNYFEKVCLDRELTRECRNRIWAFETVPGLGVVEGYAHQMLKRIVSRKDCEELCLKDGKCRAAEFDPVLTTCSLTRYDRRRTPESVEPVRNTQKVYLENQCHDDLEDCAYEIQDEKEVTFVDFAVSANSAEECRVKCDRNANFLCRSFTFLSDGNICHLSSDDTTSAGVTAFTPSRGRIFSQKKCERIANGGTTETDRPVRPGLTSTETPVRPGSSTQRPNPTNRPATRPPTRPSRPSRPPKYDPDRPIRPSARPKADKCLSRGGEEDFERTAGFRVRVGDRRGSFLLHRTRDYATLTASCIRECRASTECVAFFIDYPKGECFGVDDKSAIRLDRDPNAAFFEGVCLRGGGCEKFWAFERLLDHEMTGNPIDHLRTRNREECMEECQERRCGSASFDERSGDCVLYRDTRYTKPRALRRRPGFHYLENQCIPDRYERRSYKRPEPDMAFSLTTKSIAARSQEACMDACDGETQFTCRSFTFLLDPVSGDSCLLSSDQAQPDLLEALKRNPGSIYVARSLAGAGRDDFGSIDPGPLENNCIGRSAYERTFGYDLLASGNVFRELIRTRASRGITTECLSACTLLGPRLCAAVVVQTRVDLEQRCFALSRVSGPDNRDLAEAGDSVYYQPMCMSDRAPPCSSSWVIDRVPGFELIGFEDSIVRVASREDCSNACLEKEDCKSATFSLFNGECRLSRESRRTKPQAYRPNRATEYLESQCTREESCSEYSQYPGRYLPLVDKFEYGVRDIDDCRVACDSAVEFNCRSFNYVERQSECSLSADDSLTIGSTEILLPSRDHIYGEKGVCENVRVECTPNAMLVTVEFPEPFTGLIWAMGGGPDCQQYGEGRASVTLEIPLGRQPCGTVQDRVDMFVNHVTIQRHNVITQAGDRMVRVECSYALEDRTVTYAPQLAGIDMRMTIHPTGADRVTNTAPAPFVRLRIVDGLRRVDITETTLGDPLIFTLEIDPAADFGMFATNVEAFNEHGHRLGLIDSSGCPVNEAIFPVLEEDRGTRKNLVAPFEAFSFPASQVVNFIATVNFCQNRCEPARCSSRAGFGGTIDSHGRKRRSVNETETMETIDNSTETGNSSDDWKSSGKPLGGETLMTNGLPSAFIAKDTEVIPTTAKIQPTTPSVDQNERLPGDMNMSIKLIVRDQPLKDTKFMEGPKSNGSSGAASSAIRTRPRQSHIKTEYLDQQGAMVQPESPLGSWLFFQYPRTDVGQVVQENQMCSSTGTIIAATLGVVFVHLGIIAGFTYFYKQKKKTWRKSSDWELSAFARPRPQFGNTEQVLYRSIYGSLRGRQMSGSVPCIASAMLMPQPFTGIPAQSCMDLSVDKMV